MGNLICIKTTKYWADKVLRLVDCRTNRKFFYEGIFGERFYFAHYSSLISKFPSHLKNKKGLYITTCHPKTLKEITNVENILGNWDMSTWFKSTDLANHSVIFLYGSWDYIENDEFKYKINQIPYDQWQSFIESHSSIGKFSI